MSTQTYISNTTRKLSENLSDISVDIEDSGQSSDYFNVFRMQEEYGVGTHTVVMRGSDKLKKGTYIRLEILDEQENAIPINVPPEYESYEQQLLPNRRFTFEITDDNADGVGRIIFVGETTDDERVRYTRTFSINTNIDSYNLQNRGDWGLGKFYEVGDVVQYDGSSYACILAHESASDNQPPDTSYWKLMAQKGDQGIGLNFYIEASNGFAFKNNTGTTDLTAKIYENGNEVSADSYTWYEDGNELTGESGSTITVTASQVDSKNVYEVEMDYSGSIYSSTQAVVDIFDGEDAIIPYINTPDGVIFRNDQGTLELTGELYEEGALVSASAISYQWYQDGSAIATDTASIFLDSTAVNTSSVIKLEQTYNGTTYDGLETIYDVYDGENTRLPIIESAPDEGFRFKNSEGEITLTGSFFDGGNKVSPSNVTYEWYKNNSTSAFSTSQHVTITSASVTQKAVYNLDITYNGTTYNTQQDILDVTDGYGVLIESDGGFSFKNNSGSVTLTARLYEGGTEVVGTAEHSISYQWTKDGSNLTGETNKTLSVSATDFNESAVYGIEVTYKGDTYVFTQTLTDVEDGYNALLSNENGIVKYDEAGNSDYSSATTDLAIYRGQQDVTSDFTLSVASDSGNIGYNFDPVTGVLDITSLANGSSGYVVLEATKGSLTLSKRFNVNTVEDGGTARTLRIVSEEQIFRKFQDGTTDPQNISLSASLQNYSDTVEWRYKDNGTQFDTGDNTLVSASVLTNGSRTIVASTSAYGLSDEVTLVELEEGEDSITAILDNESHTVPAESDGSNPDLSGANCTITIYKGFTDITSEWTIQSGSSTTFAGTDYSLSGDTVTITSMDSDSEIFQFLATHPTYSDIKKNFTLSKAKAGQQGSDGDRGVSYIFRGTYASGVDYYYDHEVASDVVLDGGTYYYLSGSSDFNTQADPANYQDSGNPWEQFDGQFESVATNILLTQDATIRRKLTMGTPTDSLGDHSSFDQNGIIESLGFIGDDGDAYYGSDSSPQFSGSAQRFYKLDYQGVTAVSGSFGNWDITKGTLESINGNGSGIKLDSENKELAFFDTDGDKKLGVNINETFGTSPTEISTDFSASPLSAFPYSTGTISSPNPNSSHEIDVTIENTNSDSTTDDGKPILNVIVADIEVYTRPSGGTYSLKETGIAYATSGNTNTVQFTFNPEGDDEVKVEVKYNDSSPETTGGQVNSISVKSYSSFTELNNAGLSIINSPNSYFKMGGGFAEMAGVFNLKGTIKVDNIIIRNGTIEEIDQQVNGDLLIPDGNQIIIGTSEFTDTNGNINADHVPLGTGLEISSGNIQVNSTKYSNWNTAHDERGSQIAGDNLTWDSTNGVLDASYTNNYVNSVSIKTGDITLGRSGLGDLTDSFTTDDVPEGSNEYHTDQRVKDVLSGANTFQTLAEEDNVTFNDLEVTGTINYVNETNLQVEDKTITINKNGTDGSAEGAGIIVERPSGNKGFGWTSSGWGKGINGTFDKAIFESDIFPNDPIQGLGASDDVKFGEIRSNSIIARSNSSDVISGFQLNFAPESDHLITPYLMNDMAHAYARGSATSNINRSDLNDAFDGSANTWTVQSGDVPTGGVVVEVELDNVLTFSSTVGVEFGNHGWRTKTVQIEYSTDDGSSWTTLLSTTNNDERMVLANPNTGGTSVTNLRFTLDDCNSSQFRVTNFFAFDYQSMMATEYYLSAGGGEVWGNVTLNENLTVGKKVTAQGGVNISALRNTSYIKSNSLSLEKDTGEGLSIGIDGSVSDFYAWDDSGNSRLAFRTFHTGSSIRIGSEFQDVYIENSGNVGIGITSPQEKTHSSGWIRADSGYKVGSNTFVDSNRDVTARKGTFSGVVTASKGIDVGDSSINIDTYSNGLIWNRHIGTATGQGTKPKSYTTITNLGSTYSGAGTQIASHFSSTKDFYIRRRSDNTSSPNGQGWQPWRYLWNSGVDIWHPKRIGHDYTSGIFGEGYVVDPNASGGSFFEIDNMRVRGTFRTHIFKKDIVKASNAYLYISDAGELTTTVTTPSSKGTNFTITIKEPVFEDGDEVWFKDEDLTSGGTSIYSVEADVISYDGTNASNSDHHDYTLKLTNDGGTDVPLEAGDTFVRTSGGAILNDASSQYSPFLDVLLDSDTKVRLGNLRGISSSLIPNENTWGLYAKDNVVLEIGDSNQLVIGKNADGGTNDNHGVYIDASNYWYGNGNWRVGDGTYYLQKDSNGFDAFLQNYHWDATNLSIDSDYGIEVANVHEILNDGSFDFAGGILSGTSNSVNISEWVFEGNLFKSADASIIIRQRNVSNNNSTGRMLLGRWYNSSRPTFRITGDQGDRYVEMWYNSTDNWGLRGRQDGDTFFELGSTNRIAGWDFTTDTLSNSSLYLGSTNVGQHANDDTVVLGNWYSDGNRPTLRMTKNSGTDIVEMYYNTSADYGIRSKSGNTVDFHLGDHNIIAGWSFDSNKLTSGTMEIASSGQIRNTDNKWRLNNNGSGYLASGKIDWNPDGSGDIANGKISWDSNGNIFLSPSVEVQFGHGSNLIGDPNFRQAVEYGQYWSADVSATYGENSTYGLQMSATGSINDESPNHYIDVKGEQKIYIKARVYISSDFNGTAQVGSTQRRADNSITSYPSYTIINDGTGQTKGSWITVYGEIGVVSDAVKFQPRLSVRSNATQGYVRFDNVYYGYTPQNDFIGATKITSTLIESPTVTAGTFIGGRIESTNYNDTTPAEVGTYFDLDDGILSMGYDNTNIFHFDSANNSVTLGGTEIKNDKFIGGRIESTNYGEIDGNFTTDGTLIDLDVGNIIAEKFSVIDGSLRAENAFLKGTVQADEGYLGAMSLTGNILMEANTNIRMGSGGDSFYIGDFDIDSSGTNSNSFSNTVSASAPSAGSTVTDGPNTEDYGSGITISEGDIIEGDVYWQVDRTVNSDLGNLPDPESGYYVEVTLRALDSGGGVLKTETHTAEGSPLDTSGQLSFSMNAPTNTYEIRLIRYVEATLGADEEQTTSLTVKSPNNETLTIKSSKDFIGGEGAKWTSNGEENIVLDPYDFGNGGTIKTGEIHPSEASDGTLKFGDGSTDQMIYYPDGVGGTNTPVIELQEGGSEPPTPPTNSLYIYVGEYNGNTRLKVKGDDGATWIS